MRTLFFVDDLPTTVGATYEFNNDDANHAIRVLRIGKGEIFNLSDGAGAWATVQVLTVAKKSMQVKVVETGYQEPLETHFTIIQAIPKGDRIKESIELSTEGGADRRLVLTNETAFWRLQSAQLKDVTPGASISRRRIGRCGRGACVPIGRR